MEVDNITAFTRSGDAEDIYVKNNWRPKRGQPMPQMDGYFIGKKFGAGALAMNSIYDLVNSEGKSLGQALKVCKQSLSARRSLAHEWKMFKDLRVLGEDHAAARSHFLQAHRVMKLPNNQIVGIIMEKANGQNVSKTLHDPNFCNVRYVISLLRDLLVALDVAQRVLGFVHYDLKLDNVMEHWSCNPDPDTSKNRVVIDGVPQFKLFDFGTAVIYPDPFAVKRVHDKRLSEHRPAAAEELKHEKKHGDSKKAGRITHSAADDEFEYSEPFGCVRIYHMWWKTRGDVFRVLLALSKLLDDRVWPLEDLELVSLLFTVLEHTTNSRRIRAKFMPRAALMRKLGLPHDPEEQQRQQQPSTEQKVQQTDEKLKLQSVGPNKQAPIVVAAADMHHAIAPATPAAAVAEEADGVPGLGSRYSPVRRIAADAPRSPRVSMDVYNSNNKRFSMDGAAVAPSAVAVGDGTPNGGVVNMISSMVNSAAAGGGDKGYNNSTAGVGLSRLDTPAPGSAVEALPGVAYTRLAPVSSSTAAVAPDSMSTPLTVGSHWSKQQQQQSYGHSAPVAAAGTNGLSSIKTDVPRATAGQDAGAACGGASCENPVEPHFDINAADEGCRIDPAARVVQAMPIAPADHQSVLGSRKALKGVTAQQLLLEPIVQSLLTKV